MLAAYGLPSQRRYVSHKAIMIMSEKIVTRLVKPPDSVNGLHDHF
jgi:hypothetical protein